MNPRLEKAIEQKESELTARHSDLTSIWPKQSWVKKQIDVLGKQIQQLKDGVIDELPRCCHDQFFICLTATEGFEGCAHLPYRCGYSFKEQKEEKK